MDLKKVLGLEQGYNSPLSYATIKNSIYEFRRSGHNSSEWHALDQPGHLFFKVVFHFWNGDEFHNSNSNQQGLLAPTWNWNTGLTKTNEDSEDSNSHEINTQSVFIDGYVKWLMKTYNNTEISAAGGGQIDEDHLETQKSKYGVDLISDSAYNYLIRNDELDRAEKLKQFITLLSNISSNSPWYFSEISGLDAVLERPFKSDAENIVVEKPKSFTIKCLPDAMDNRIATLLDLYKDVVYSHTWHRVILPSNLRKFDMSIYIFESPILNLHSFKGKNGLMKESSRSLSNGLPVSYKRIELHDCEFEYNGAKSGYSSLNNTEGFQQIFEIPIVVGDAYEHRYNVFIDREIGDMSAVDRAIQTYERGKFGSVIVDAPQITSNDVIDNLNSRLDEGQRARVDLINILDDVTGNIASQFISNQLLGNIFKGSISDMLTSAERIGNNLNSGNVVGAIKNINHSRQQLRNGWTMQDYSNNISSTYGTVSRSEPMPTKNIFTQ